MSKPKSELEHLFEGLEFTGIVFLEAVEPEGGWKIAEFKPVIMGPFRALTDEEIGALE